MTATQANHILDMARCGADVPQDLIEEALKVTGDMQPNFSSVIDWMNSVILSKAWSAA